MPRAAEKQRLVQGVGWKEYSLQRGFYVGSMPGVSRLGVGDIRMQDAGQARRPRVHAGPHTLCLTLREGRRINPAGSWRPGPQGFRNNADERQKAQVTAWPSSLAVAATWDVALVERWGEALGEEFSAKGANVILGPGVNVHRVARGGRNAEYLSGEVRGGVGSV